MVLDQRKKYFYESEYVTCKDLDASINPNQSETITG